MSMRSSSPVESVVVPELEALPSYLRVLPAFHVVLCTTHGGCYTRQNLSRYLLEKHHLQSGQRRRIASSSELDPVAASNAGVVHPRDGINEVRGLPTMLGFLCHLPNCDFRSTSTDWMRQHYNKTHQWQVLRQGAIPWHKAYLQTLFQQKQC